MHILLFVKPKINILFTKKLLSLKYYLSINLLLLRMKKTNKKSAFSLAELVIAVTISSIIFLWVLNLVWGTLQELSASNRSSELIVSLNDIIHEFEVLSRSYENKEMLVDEPSWKGTDVLMLTNSGSTWWVIIALVDPRSKKIFNSATSYPLYNQKHLWYRRLNASELEDINDTPANVAELLFYTDKIFSEIYFRDFQVALFNDNDIADMDLSLLLRYWKESEWILWEDLGNENLYNVNLNF